LGRAEYTDHLAAFIANDAVVIGDVHLSDHPNKHCKIHSNSLKHKVNDLGLAKQCKKYRHYKKIYHGGFDNI
jgi:hypothetical protein